jgi:hypothetical protein
MILARVVTTRSIPSSWTSSARALLSLRHLTTDDVELIENGYPLDFARFTETMDVKKPGAEKYAFDDLQIEVVGDIALFRYRLVWREGGKTTFSGIETGCARRLNGRWLLARSHDTWLARRASIARRGVRVCAGSSSFQPVATSSSWRVARRRSQATVVLPAAWLRLV